MSGPYEQSDNPERFQDEPGYDDAYQDGHEPEQAQINNQGQAPPRKYKYSTANMNQANKWKKWCSIFLLFLLFLAFMIGLSMLFNHFFFGDVSDNGPDLAPPSDNVTFSQSKRDIDVACSEGSFIMDGGEACKEACAPHYFLCCDPFDEFNLYNITDTEEADQDIEVFNSTVKTNITVSGSSAETLSDKNTTFLQEYGDVDLETCSFDSELQGCVSYAKCHAVSGQTDPAKANLPDLCKFETLDKDPDGCIDRCEKLECCFALDSTNCLAEKFDLCLDYAPCQNLRYLDDPNVLETAPRELDFDCTWQQPACNDNCKVAECCGDPSSTCFQANFMSCLTYAPCNDVTGTSIILQPQFNKVSKPPDIILSACNKDHLEVLEPSDKSCNDICAEVACCWDQTPSKNCFHDDPLGCLAWEAQCQTTLG